MIGEASAVAANDSGPAHLAAALGVPSVTLYGATRPAHNGTHRARADPSGRRIPLLALPQPALHLSRPPAVTPACYGSLPPEMVWREIEKLIG